MERHKEISIKVNAFVDEGIAHLVSSLSLFPKVQTFESCQGYGNKNAFVMFFVHGNTEITNAALFSFVFELLEPRLSTIIGDSAEVTIHRSESGGFNRGEISLHPSMIDNVARAVEVIASANTIPEQRKTESK